MNLASLIPLVLKTSIALEVFGLGLLATLQDATYLFRTPRLLLRAILSMNIVMPVLAWALVSALHLHPAVEIALTALSVSPVPPLLPRKQLKAGAGTAYAFGLLVAESVLAIVFIPITVQIFERALGTPASMSPGAVAMLVLMTVLAPLAVGILIRRVAPGVAGQIAKPVALTATVLLVLGAVPILFTAMPAIASLIGNGTLLAIAAFNVLGLAAGDLLGRPGWDDRTALALSTASRHPGVAIAIARANFPNQKLAAAAVVLYLIVNLIASALYLAWRRRRRAIIPGAR